MQHQNCVYCIAGNVGGGKVGGNAKFGILVGLNLADLQFYISHTHLFKILTRVTMEREVDVAKFVLESVVREFHAYQTIWEAAIGQ